MVSGSSSKIPPSGLKVKLGVGAICAAALLSMGLALYSRSGSRAVVVGSGVGGASAWLAFAMDEVGRRGEKKFDRWMRRLGVR